MKKIKFKDFITLQRGFDLPRRKIEYGPIPVVGSTSIVGWHKEHKIDGPGVITGRSGSLGIVQYIEDQYWPHNTTLWVKDFRGNKPKYVYYFLNNFPLKNFNSGAGVPTLNRNHLGNYDIQIHDHSSQEKIADLLSAYDDLIENNTRRIAILEEMAQRIYKKWFVDFKYPGHEDDTLVDSKLGMIPEGWEVGCVSDYYDVRSGFAFKSKDMVESGDYGIVKIKNIQSDGLNFDTIQYISEALIEDRAYSFELIENDLLIAMTGATVGKVGLMPKSKDKFLLNQRVGKFFPKVDFQTNNMFMYQLSKSNNFQISVVNIAQGAAQPNISGKQIGSIKFPGPPSQLILRFEKLCESIKDNVLVLNFKNQILRQTRDHLLPKLISGQVDVSDLNIDTGADA